MKAQIIRPRSAEQVNARNITVSIAVSLLAAVGAPTRAAAASCESLAFLSLANTTITSAQSVPAGTFTLPGGQQLPNLPASCRVTGVIKPSTDSNILFEVWLPEARWNS